MEKRYTLLRHFVFECWHRREDAFRRLSILIAILVFAPALWANQACPSNVPNGSSLTCHYFSNALGSDTSYDGTQETVSGSHGPLQHAPGMPGCAGNCSNTSLGPNDALIFRGEVYPTSGFLPWAENSGVIYVGYDPNWNDGTLKSVKPTSSGQGCTSVAVTLSGGGAAIQGSATANFLTSAVPAWAGNLQHITINNMGSGYTTNPSVSFSGSLCNQLPTAVADIHSPVFDGSAAAWTTSTLYTGQYMVYICCSNVEVDNIEVRGMLLSNAVPNSCNAITMLGIEGDNPIANHVYVHNFGTANYPQTGSTQPCDNSQGLGMAGSGNGTPGTIQNSWADNYEAEAAGPCGWTGANSPGANWPYCAQSIAVTGATTVTNTVIHDARGGLYDATGQSQMFTGLNIWNIMYDVGSQHGDGIYLHNGGVFADNVIHDTEGASNYLFEFCGGSNCNTPNTLYVFNNVFWNQQSVAQGFFNVSGEFVTDTTSWATNPTLYLYNNSGDCDGDGGGACMGVGQYFNGSNSLWSQTTFLLYNNHAISNESSTHWYSAPSSGACTSTNGCGSWNGLTQPQSAGTRTTIDSLNTVMSTATASTQGYEAWNNYAPTALTNATVTAWVRTSLPRRLAAALVNSRLSVKTFSVRRGQRTASGRLAVTISAVAPSHRRLPA